MNNAFTNYLFEIFLMPQEAFNEKKWKFLGFALLRIGIGGAVFVCFSRPFSLTEQLKISQCIRDIFLLFGIV